MLESKVGDYVPLGPSNALKLPLCPLPHPYCDSFNFPASKAYRLCVSHICLLFCPVRHFCFACYPFSQVCSVPTVGAPKINEGIFLSLLHLFLSLLACIPSSYFIQPRYFVQPQPRYYCHPIDATF